MQKKYNVLRYNDHWLKILTFLFCFLDNLMTGIIQEMQLDVGSEPNLSQEKPIPIQLLYTNSITLHYMHCPRLCSFNNFRDMNYYLVNFCQVTDRETDGKLMHKSPLYSGTGGLKIIFLTLSFPELVQSVESYNASVATLSFVLFYVEEKFTYKSLLNHRIQC